MKRASITDAKNQLSALIARLVRAGVLRPAQGTAEPALLAAALPRLRRGASAVAALLAEREEGR